MTATHKGIMESVKDKLIGSIKGTGEIPNTVVDTVSGTLVTTIKGTGAVGTALTSQSRPHRWSVSKQTYTVVPSAPTASPQGKREHFG